MNKSSLKKLKHTEYVREFSVPAGFAAVIWLKKTTSFFYDVVFLQYKAL